LTNSRSVNSPAPYCKRLFAQNAHIGYILQTANTICGVLLAGANHPAAPYLIPLADLLDRNHYLSSPNLRVQQVVQLRDISQLRIHPLSQHSWIQRQYQGTGLGMDSFPFGQRGQGDDARAADDLACLLIDVLLVDSPKRDRLRLQM